jgi:hypothetical protein
MEASSTVAFTTMADTLKAEQYAFAASVDTCKEKEEADHCTASADYWKVLAHSWNASAVEPRSSPPAKLAAALEALAAWLEATVKASAKAVVVGASTDTGGLPPRLYGKWHR